MVILHGSSNTVSGIISVILNFDLIIYLFFNFQFTAKLLPLNLSRKLSFIQNNRSISMMNIEHTITTLMIVRIIHKKKGVRIRFGRGHLNVTDATSDSSWESVWKGIAEKCMFEWCIFWGSTDLHPNITTLIITDCSSNIVKKIK